METFLLYSNGLLMVFALCHYLFLRSSNLFIANRIYLVSAMVLALVLPLIKIERIILVPASNTDLSNLYSYASTGVEIQSIDWMQIILGLLASGMFIGMIRFVLDTLKIRSIINKSTLDYQENNQGQVIKYRSHNDKRGYFSFIHTILYPKKADQSIKAIALPHERAHVVQRHYFDLFLNRLMQILFWYNPAIYYLKRASEHNLEYLADQEALKHIEKKTYQYALLEAYTQNETISDGLSMAFGSHPLKKRIKMINTQKLNPMTRLGLLSPLPILIIAFLQLNITEVKAQEKQAFLMEHYEAEYTLITAESTDAEIDELIAELNKKGQNLKVSNLKKNEEGKIIRINLTLSANGSKTTAQFNNNTAIPNIKVGIENQYPVISVASDKPMLHEVNGTHKNAFFITGDGEEMEYTWTVDSESEGHGNAMFISEDGDNIHVTVDVQAEGENANVWVSKDGDTTIVKELKVIKEVKGEKGEKPHKIIVKTTDGKEVHEVIEIKEIKTSKGTKGTKPAKGEKIIIREVKSDDGKTIMVEEIKDTDVDVFVSGKDEKIHVMTKDGEEPYILVDGKETSRAEMEQLDESSIEKIEVFKGEAAEKKYGDKAKNGVVEITTKKE